MLEIILGSTASGKTDSMIEKVNDFINDNRKVLVIVPEQFTFEYEHMLYKKLGANTFNKISVKSFKRLSMQILEESGEKCSEYADNYTKTVLMSLAIKHVLQNEGLGFYAKTSKNIGFSSLMLDCVSDLRQSGLSDSELINGSANLKGTLAEKFRDIVNIYFTYNSFLKNNGLEDSLSVITQAAKSAATCGFFEQTAVFIDEFKSFTNDEKQLIGVMLSQSEVFCTLDTNDENSKLLYLYSVNKTFSSLKRLAQNACAKVRLTRLKDDKSTRQADIKHLSNNIFRNSETEKIRSENIKIVDAVNAYDECEYVCSQIKHLVNEDNYSFDDIAIVTRNSEGYESILDEYAKIYEIPLFKSLPKTPFNTALSIFIEATLDLAFGKINTEKVLRYSKSGLLGISVQEIAELENFCYIWDIDDKLWLKPFSQNDASTENAENLRKRIIEPLIKLRENCENASGEKITKALYEHFADLNLHSNLETMSKRYDSECEAMDANALERSRDLKLLWNVIVDILDTFYKLLKDITLTLEEYKEMFLCALSRAHYSNAPQQLNCVSVSQIQLTRLNSPKVVFIIGANEGFFPRNSLVPGLFSANDSIALGMGGIELAKSDEQIYSEECFAAYAAMSAPTDKLFITYSLLDKSNNSCSGAYTLKLIENIFENKITLNANSLPDEFYCVTKFAAYRRFVLNYNKNTEFRQSCEIALLSDDIYREKISALKNASVKQEFELKEKSNILGLYGSNVQMSASKLETFCSCPFRFYMNYGLKVRPLQKKSITVNEKGSIVHYCLEQIFKAHEKAEFLTLKKAQIEQCVNEYLDTYLKENLGGYYRESDKFNYNLKLIAENTCTIIENLQREFSASEFYPCEFEYYLKKDYRIDMPDISSPKITLNGITDRIDLYVSEKGKFIRVIDYKTGKKAFSLSDLLQGKNMQMFLYLFALTDKHTQFSDCNPCGVLYYRAVEASPSLDRNDGEEECIEIHNKSRKMIGVILNDDDIIDAMDKTGGSFIPVKRNKNGSISALTAKNLLNESQFKFLDRYCENTVKHCGKRILSGDIAALPIKSGCDFCDYKNVCNNHPAERIIEIEKTDEDLVAKMMNGEYSYGERIQIVSENVKEDEDDVDE